MGIKQKVAKVKGVADIVFCIDATGSMQDCIDNVKNNVETFTQSIKDNSPNTKVDWRARILFYRDFKSDSDYLVNNNPFVNTPEEIKSQLDATDADGGGDEPESTLDAIAYAILKSDWRTEAHKVVAVFTDATPLLTLDSKTTSDLGIPSDYDIIPNLIKENRIKLFLYGQECDTYEKLSKESRTNIIQLKNAVEELKTADFKTILDTIGKTVSQLASAGEVL